MRTTSCPRCSTLFECRPDDIENCHCSQVQITTPVLSSITDTYADCLCHNCLEAVSSNTGEHTD